MKMGICLDRCSQNIKNLSLDTANQFHWRHCLKLENIISELHFIGDVEKAILQKISRDKKSIEKISKTAYQGEKLNFALCRRMPLTRLSVVIYLLTSKYEEYRA